MENPNSRTEPAILPLHGRELAVTIESVAPRLTEAAETAALYVMVCAFWGLILYVALTYALP
ncbi:MAG TPA: hypothetical protein VKX16_04900 [Chloroflexota bacterium]|nr:hypothetical protein [Chloroflexota bacterium]